MSGKGKSLKSSASSGGRKAGDGAKKLSITDRAGLKVSVPRVARVGKTVTGITVPKMPAIYVTAVLEYLLGEILELSANRCREDKKSRIQSKHISHTVHTDEELNFLFKDGVFRKAGVVPNINPALLPKKSAAKSRKGEDGSQEY